MSSSLHSVSVLIPSLITLLGSCSTPQSTSDSKHDFPTQMAREAFYSSEGQWANYGNDPGGMRYSPVAQINRENVSGLKEAWSYRTGELDTYRGTDLASKSAFEATPLMIDGTLYFCTPTGRTIALNAASGEERWVYNPGLDLKGQYSEVASRGVSKWVDDKKQPGEPGYMKILTATIDGRLIAVDYQTGQPVADFGQQGVIDLREGLGRIQVTSPPAVIGDAIIIGSTMGDNWRYNYPAGVVRAYDARSGKQLWSWDPIPREDGDPGIETWEGPKARETGGGNAWAPLSVDLERDLVFVPTSCPSPDYYGGERLGDNLYTNSLVALKASTGEVRWHFQTVHHDIWDYDNPAQPVAVTIEKGGESIPAVVQVTKMGMTFVFHRETGKPVFPIEERPVPSSDVTGERTSETQPFPVGLPLLGLQKVGPEDAWGPTPELEEMARQRIKKHINKGIYTPPSLQGSIITPGNVGGMNWSGASYDPERNLLVANVNRLAALITLFEKGENSRASVSNQLPRAEVAPQEGTPYIMSRDYLFTMVEGNFLMQTKPPWGTLAAIDLTNGQLKWEVPLGIMMDPSQFPEATGWGSVNIGGSITTAGGLVFVAATLDGYFRAFDIDSGEELWAMELPAGGQATPMSYQWDGKQYIVIAAGGHGKFGTRQGDYVVAYALD